MSENDDKNRADAVVLAQQDLANVRDEAGAQAYVKRMLRDPQFRSDYLSTIHEKATGVDAQERRARHQRAVDLVALVHRQAEEASKVPAPAALQGEERREVETKIAHAMRNPAYLDKRHRDHDRAVSEVAGLYMRLGPRTT